MPKGARRDRDPAYLLRTLSELERQYTLATHSLPWVKTNTGLPQKIRAKILRIEKLTGMDG